MTNQELEVVNHLVYYVVGLGFFTGIFFAGRLFDILEFFIDRYRIHRRYKRFKRHNHEAKKQELI